MGSLGVLHAQLGAMHTGGSLDVVKQLSQLMLRDLERGKAARSQDPMGPAKGATNHAVGALKHFQEAVVLCDLSVAAWPLLFVGERWCRLTGMSEAACLHSALWHVFRAADSSSTVDYCQRFIAARAPFTLTLTGTTCTRLTLEMRPATADHLAAALPHAGSPFAAEGLDVSAVGAGTDCLWFGVVLDSEQLRLPSPQTASSAGSAAGTPVLLSREPSHRDTPAELVISSMPSTATSVLSRSSFDLTFPDQLHDIQLGPMLGRGSYARVYQGNWRSAKVAIKILTSWVDPEVDMPTAPLLEALLSKKLAHPNVVHTYEYALKLSGRDEDEDAELGDWWGDDFEELEGPGAQPLPLNKRKQQVWILQQFCDRGTLGEAISRGWLRRGRHPGAPPDIVAVLATAQEIASALRFCHQRGVLHGDLTAGNVLLVGDAHEEDAWDPRDFAAKVGDFGLSRLLDNDCVWVHTKTCGTLPYMPLELIEEQLLTRAADVYSFGVLCWEMLAGQRAWAGRQAVQILYARTVLRLGLEVPQGCPDGLKALVEACLSDDHTQRPTFDEIAATVDSLLASEIAAAGAPLP